jgi:DNA-binding transcriptional LysR family regulator
MEIREIRYFLAVADAGSFTRAAEQLDLSQPAITSGVRRLESELGGPLFYREGKRLLLTDLGELMRPQLAGIVEQASAAQDAAENFRLLNQVPLRVGIMATIGPNRFSELLARFQAEHPGVERALHEGLLADLVRQLDANEVDLAILSSPKDLRGAYRITTLYEERYVVIFRKGHRLEALPSVRLADLNGEAYVDRLSCELRELVMSVCEEREVDLYARFRSAREDWVQAMVLAGIGFAFMPEHSVTQTGLLSRPLVDPQVSRSVMLVRVPGRLAPAAGAFVRCVEREYGCRAG